MDEIIEKGFAKVVDITPVDGKLWYLPYHGAYHHAKPNKICVIFITQKIRGEWSSWLKHCN